MRSITGQRILQALRPRARVLRALVAFAAVGSIATACDVHGVSAPGSLTTLTITPNPHTLAVGTTQQFTVVGRDFSGAVIPNLTPTWAVTAGGGTISASGLFTAGTTPGTFANTVTATADGKSASATVIVVAGPLASITVTPNPVSLAIGATQTFTAVGRDASGNIVPITPSWSVVAGGGSINPTSGLFTAGMTVGTFPGTVRASVGAIAGVATVNVTAGQLTTITVTPNPATLPTGAVQQFTATGQDAGGNAVAITPVWSVTNGGGTIDATGRFTAGTTGGTFANTVRATSGTVSGSATVIVTAVLASITVTPNPDTTQVNGTQQFFAAGRDQAGNSFPTTIVWSVVNGGGTIDARTGVFTAGNVPGTFANTIRATDGTVSGFATVVVTAAPPVLATITVTPNPDTTQVNGTQQFFAAGRDQAGNAFPTTIVWSVVNGGGTINATTGVFTAGNTPGTFANTIRATDGTVSGFATVVVTAAPPVLATITVTPNPDTTLANTTQQFSAVGRDGSGQIVSISPVWSVVNGGGTIDPVTGLFTAGNLAGTFNNTVRATSGTVSGFATVVVTSPPPPPANFLRSAAANGIMAGTAFTCVANGLISADIAISPGSTVTGFPPCVITGTQNLANAVAAQNQIDLTSAYNTLAGLPCPASNMITSDLGGTTKTAGVYCSATSIGVTGNLTLDGGGDPNALFVFQAGTGLTTAGNIILINGASANNVYWQVGSSATIGTASQWQGNIVALTSITLVDNANLVRGRALARNGAVSLGTNNTITLP